MADRVPLVEMVEAIDDEAASARISVEIYNRENPNAPLPPTDAWVRRARALKAAADVFRVMASYEDRSREFVGKLMKDYAEGRWP